MKRTGFEEQRGVPGAALDLGRGTLAADTAKLSESEKTSPLIDEMSEQDGECDLGTGGQIGPKDWQFLGGGGGGAGGELDGVEVAGNREGVTVITETLDRSLEIKSSLSSLTDSCLARGGTQESPGFP